MWLQVDKTIQNEIQKVKLYPVDADGVLRVNSVSLSGVYICYETCVLCDFIH